MISPKELIAAGYKCELSYFVRSIDQFTDLVYSSVTDTWYLSKYLGSEIIELRNIDSLGKAEILFQALQGNISAVLP